MSSGDVAALIAAVSPAGLCAQQRRRGAGGPARLSLADGEPDHLMYLARVRSFRASSKASPLSG